MVGTKTHLVVNSNVADFGHNFLLLSRLTKNPKHRTPKSQLPYLVAKVLLPAGDQFTQVLCFPLPHLQSPRQLLWFDYFSNRTLIGWHLYVSVSSKIPSHIPDTHQVVQRIRCVRGRNQRLSAFTLLR